jgi:glycerol-3-phosphate dehydrogenase
LPGLGGEALAHAARQRLPRARVAFMSGASHASSVADALLPKPYDAGQLQALLEKLA